jgi:hypothetical protein
MTKGDWMRSLALHLRRMRHAYPDDELVVAFDIDGTIIDTRHRWCTSCCRSIGIMGPITSAASEPPT